MTLFSYNVLNVTPLKYVLMNNQECKIILEMININSYELLFYPYSININKCSGNINNPYAKLCVRHVVKKT